MKPVQAMLVAVAAAGVAAFEAWAHRHGPPCATDPRCFRASEAVLETVADARWVITVRDAGSMMKTGAGAAVRSFLSTLAEAGTGRRARDAAALLARAGETPAEGFATLARREIRIAVRDDGGWIAFARLDRDEQGELLARWAPSIEADGSLLDRPTGVSLMSRDRWLVLASDRSVLPDGLPEGWQRDPAAAPSEEAATTARIEAVARRPCGGDPIRAVGECEGERFSMRLRFRAGDRSPFPGPLPGLDGPAIGIENADLDGLAGDSVVCEIASLRTGVSADDGPFLAELPEIRMPATFRTNLGARRIVAIGEIDGRALDRPLAMHCPAVAVACEVEDVEQARGDQDSLVLSAIAGMRRLLESDPETVGAVPAVEPVEPGRRDVALDRAAERLAGRNPWLSAAGLAWCTVDGPSSHWQVYASHPEWRDRVSARIGRMSGEQDRREGDGRKYLSVGRFNGERLARHLEGWLAERNRFDAMSRTFWDEISVCARLARHVPELGWKASRRGGAILIEIDARLAKP